MVPAKVTSGMAALTKNLGIWTQIAGQLAITAASLSVVTGQ